MRCRTLSLHDFSLVFFNLEGKTAIVTGGNTGPGQGYAVALPKAGADLLEQKQHVKLSIF